MRSAGDYYGMGGYGEGRATAGAGYAAAAAGYGAYRYPGYVRAPVQIIECSDILCNIVILDARKCWGEVVLC